MFSNHSRINLETNNKKTARKIPKTMELINNFLNSAWVKGKHKGKFLNIKNCIKVKI